MNSKFLFVFVTFISSVYSIIVQDYCDSALCDINDGNFYNHIGCNNTGEFSPLCPENVKVLPMNYDLINLILKTINQMRNKIAAGDIDGFEPAVRMPTMLWDNELAELSELHVKNCDIQNDECRSTKSSKFAGQIADITYLDDFIVDAQSEVTGMLYSWFNDYRYANESIIFKYVEPENEKLNYKRFTLMINQKVNRIGCAISTFTTLRREKNRNTLLMTCNLSYTNIADESVYKIGEPCSKCLAGCSKYFNALCDSHEYVKNVPDSLLNMD